MFFKKPWQDIKCSVAFLVSGPERHAQIMRWCGLEQVLFCPKPVPTSDSDQPSPRLWLPNPHYLSPTRRSSMPMTRDKWNECNRQREKDRNGGHQFSLLMGLSVASCVDGEGPSSTLSEHPKIDHLPGSVRIRYRAWAWTL